MGSGAHPVAHGGDAVVMRQWGCSPACSLKHPCIWGCVVVDNRKRADATVASSLQTGPPSGGPERPARLSVARPAAPPAAKPAALQRNRNEMHSAFSPSLLLSPGFSPLSVFLKAFMAGLGGWEKRFFPGMDQCPVCHSVGADRVDLC